jgi:hypothetical protein
MTDLLDDETDETLFDHLYDQDLLGYGSRFRRAIVWDFLDMVDLQVKTRQEHKAFELKELAAITPVREILLHQGKYLKQDGDFYRVFLPSENARKIAGYYRSAQGKVLRGQILSATTPTQPGEVSTTDAKIAMRLDAMEREVQHQKNLS